MSIRRPHDLMIAILFLSAAACSSEPTTVATEPLCSGGAEARLSYLVEGGFVAEAYSFYGAYGHSFFVIDGACHFWVGGDPLVGVKSATLTVEQADSIAKETHFGEIPALAAHPDTDSCPDAGNALLGAAGKAINCTCGCEGKLPPAIGEAFARAREIHTGLVTSGAASDGPLRAAAAAVADDPKSAAPPGKTLAWPLPWSPATIAFGDSITVDAGKLIDAEADRMALRQLRSMAAALGTTPSIHVRTADGALFDLYVRDEPPELVQQSITALRSR
jgi:hypothetical protein